MSTYLRLGIEIKNHKRHKLIKFNCCFYKHIF